MNTLLSLLTMTWNFSPPLRRETLKKLIMRYTAVPKREYVERGTNNVFSKTGSWVKRFCSRCARWSCVSIAWRLEARLYYSTILLQPLHTSLDSLSSAPLTSSSDYFLVLTLLQNPLNPFFSLLHSILLSVVLGFLSFLLRIRTSTCTLRRFPWECAYYTTENTVST